MAVGTPLFVASQLGLRTILLTSQTAWPWRTYLTLRLFGTLAAVICLCLFVLVVPAIPLSLGLAVVALKLFDSIADLDFARLQYHNHLATLGILGVAGALVSIVGSISAAALFQSVLAAVVAAALASAAVAVVATARARHLPYSASAPGGYRAILGASIPVTSAQLLASLLTYLPVLFLSMWGDLATVGIYAGVAYVLTAADLMGSTLAKLMISPLMEVAKNCGRAAVASTSRRLTLRIMIVGLGICAALMQWGSGFFSWVYGPEFALPWYSLALFALAAIFIVMSYTLSVSLNVLNAYLSVTVSFAAACIVAVVVGSILHSFGVQGLIVGPMMAASGAATRALLMLWRVTKASR
ncbi:hypothetical protein [Tessaracoccus oleiagri]|uniref:hypothetical protein n=1 Tax=Tessaracoccus oleiagri TaxID=686624 RepID=UPI00115FC69A|nr:hypothetical protein [Tessaracoccus oleiagri]